MGGHGHSHLEEGNGLEPGCCWGPVGRDRRSLQSQEDEVVVKVGGQQGPWETLESRSSCTSDSAASLKQETPQLLASLLPSLK